MESEPSLKNKILVIGHPGVGKLDLVKKILGHNDRTERLGAGPQTTVPPLCIPMTLDTKYYTAEVVFWVDSISTAKEEEPKSAEWSVVAHAIDGFIFVYDRQKPDTFEPLRVWTPFLAENTPSVALCIANVIQGSTATTLSHLDSHKEFCIENGIEFVDLHQLEGTPSSIDAFEDRVGFERIIEALESNMWDGMVRKRAVHDREKIQEKTEVGLVDDDQTRFADLSLEEMPSILDISQTRAMIFRKLETNAPEDDSDDDGFEHALKTLQGFREYGQALPDAERRALAAKVACAVAGIGLLDDDDEDIDDTT
ncbi:uncharacterized protein SPPG_07545 [Spizellomyces punctatus DAOM BR117]|uniref:Uncharacterized protein n=1 Tax=Spizellomyces punctatus (strain DAOM BR117) TaxID=645134 RepID=A0A0L0H6N8_SPIPD|nr:uncharacterized protein SPPG_07545 [Spizellomyces punctatus DAOM BR117]KNC97155.1 hypothetical protein SPPG_07545 [Spizellomyces punctatus DAOM BR117]|eukprot:XP_016605195.1 hypothetical protein SPPG_07545 [Spizellomyces punctatus DAOM BR117]